MELAFDSHHRAFQAEVRRFIDRHWPAGRHRPAPARGPAAAQRSERTLAEQAWIEALLSRGWSVPSWPVAHGGCGWTPTRMFIWDQEMARAQVPRRSDTGVRVVGPLVCRWGNPAQQAQWLPPIREGRVRCCEIRPAPGASAVTADCRPGHYVVNAERARAFGAEAADWALCLVSTEPAMSSSAGLSLLLIDMRSRGVVVHADASTTAGRGVSAVTLSAVQVPTANRIGRENEGSTYLDGIPGAGYFPGASVATSRQRFERLAQIAADIPDGDLSVADGEAFQRRYRELEVELLGIEILALRSLADVEAAQGVPAGPSILQTLVELKNAALGQRIAQLTVETLGYYALPFPDELLIDNEGPIGHDYALSAMQSWLSSEHGGSQAHHKDAIARSAFDL